MPTLIKMSDDKKTEDFSTVVFTEMAAEAPPRKTKKYVIVAVSAILGAAIILAAILVGMYMFTQAQKEIIQYAMQFGSNSKQDVTSDPNENVVQYHVSNPSQDAWIVNEFNRGIQLVKIVTGGKTNCYVYALNRTIAMDLSQFNGPNTAELKDAISVMYRISDTPIVDTSFLGKTARATCQGISVYWLFPYCMNGDVNKATNGTKPGNSKTKRDTSTKTKVDTPTKTKFDIPTKTKFDIPTKTKFGVPTKTKRDIHTKTKVDTPIKTKFDTPTKTKFDIATKTKFDIPTKTKFDASTKAKRETLTKNKRAAPY